MIRACAITNHYYRIVQNFSILESRLSFLCSRLLYWYNTVSDFVLNFTKLEQAQILSDYELYTTY